MIHEFALDPIVLRDWQVFKYLAAGLGMSRGRVLARYPRDWPRLAYQAVKELDDNAKKRVETWLADRAKGLLTAPRASAHPYTLPSWIANAVAEHQRRPFHAIIADEPAKTNPPILRYSEIDETEPLWSVTTQRVVARNATDIPRLAAPLLAHASAIRFIDPYFTGDPDQVAILVGSLALCVSATSIELHVDGRKVSLAAESHLLTALRGK